MAFTLSRPFLVSEIMLIKGSLMARKSAQLDKECRLMVQSGIGTFVFVTIDLISKL